MRTTLLLLLSLLGCAWTHADTPAPQPFVATYAVRFRGIDAGTLTFSLTKDAATGHYIYETHASPTMLARLVVSRNANERSEMQIGPDGVRPIRWQLDDGKSGSAKDGRLQFDWASRRVSGEVESERVELPTEPGIQDRLSIQIAATTALLRGVEPGTIPLIDDNRVKRYTYTKKQPETLDTALGKLDTVLYESTREGSSRISRFWMAPKLEFLPARAEQVRKGKVETVMVLTELKQGS